MNQSSAVIRLNKSLELQELVNKQNAKKHQWVNNPSSSFKDGIILFFVGISICLFVAGVFLD